jgi:nucleoid-associated protein YgaU
MSLANKYVNVSNTAQALGIKGYSAAESAGKLAIKGTAEYQLQKDQVWDAIKKNAGWESEVVADIKVEKSDIYGVWEVKPGDSLSKIAKSAYDDAGQYMRIFEANKNILKDPNMIHPGQKLVIPKK